ncbi:MAG: biotin-dependent carboxylase-like uncharacterized protein [Glaciecola sp.]|jgi:biotin-dependent carboxylase-like uncharacterized protein
MKILTSGLYARFTDHGRIGHQHKGFTQSGALDSNSHNLANAILGKALNSPTIEILFGGFKVIATEDIVIAVTGAETSIKLDNSPQSINTAFCLLKGQTLEIGYPSLGARNYIACHKDYDIAYFLDSCCMVTRERINAKGQTSAGLQFNEIVKYRKVGDGELSKVAVNNICNMTEQVAGQEKKVNPLLLTKLANEYIVRVVLGYQHNLFDHKMKALFFNQRFVVSEDVNSMGMRLEGKSIAQKSVKMYSEGIANGAIQITPNGLPIIMLGERQTIGGYPKVGSVISIDLPELGQCRPGSYIRFEECDMLTARQLWLLRQRGMKNVVAHNSVATNSNVATNNRLTTNTKRMNNSE